MFLDSMMFLGKAVEKQTRLVRDTLLLESRFQDSVKLL